MAVTMVGRWPVQLRLGVEGEAEVPDVVASLGVEDRRAVVECLADLMTKAAIAAASKGGDDGSQGSQGDQDQASGRCKIA